MAQKPQRKAKDEKPQIPAHHHPEIVDLYNGQKNTMDAMAEIAKVVSTLGDAFKAHEHEAKPYEHQHDLTVHEHAHEHRDLRGQFRGAVRALLAVMEAGNFNSEQRHLLHNVSVVIGDAHGLDCAHENAVYEAGDKLVCQDCRAVLPSPDPAG